MPNINPLTATLFPKNRTHWLNILHAGWPGGLILGALLGLSFPSGLLADMARSIGPRGQLNQQTAMLATKMCWQFARDIFLASTQISFQMELTLT